MLLLGWEALVIEGFGWLCVCVVVIVAVSKVMRVAQEAGLITKEEKREVGTAEKARTVG